MPTSRTPFRSCSSRATPSSFGTRSTSTSSRRRTSMQLYIDQSVTVAEVENSASGMGIALYEASDEGVRTRGKNAGRRLLKFLLRPAAPDRFRKVNYDLFGSGRRRKAWAVCWHGHYVFMAR